MSEHEEGGFQGTDRNIMLELRSERREGRWKRKVTWQTWAAQTLPIRNDGLLGPSASPWNTPSQILEYAAWWHWFLDLRPWVNCAGLRGYVVLTVGFVHPPASALGGGAGVRVAEARLTRAACPARVMDPQPKLQHQGSGQLPCSSELVMCHHTAVLVGLSVPV